MLIVRNIFVAKPGHASKLAAKLKEAIAAIGPRTKNSRVLTDLTGEFNRVILEHEVENLAAFEKPLKEYSTDPTIGEKFKGYTEMWQNGNREILQVM
jgi:hypothetical protein